MTSVDVFTSTEAAMCYPTGELNPSHDTFTHLLQRRPPNTDALWDEIIYIVRPQDGYLVIGDTTLDKLYAENMDLVYHQWSGKQHRLVNESIFVRCSGQMETP